MNFRLRNVLALWLQSAVFKSRHGGLHQVSTYRNPGLSITCLLIIFLLMPSLASAKFDFKLKAPGVSYDIKTFNDNSTFEIHNLSGKTQTASHAVFCSSNIESLSSWQEISHFDLSLDHGESALLPFTLPEDLDVGKHFIVIKNSDTGEILKNYTIIIADDHSVTLEEKVIVLDRKANIGLLLMISLCILMFISNLFLFRFKRKQHKSYLSETSKDKWESLIAKGRIETAIEGMCDYAKQKGNALAKRELLLLQSNLATCTDSFDNGSIDQEYYLVQKNKTVRRTLKLIEEL